MPSTYKVPTYTCCVIGKRKHLDTVCPLRCQISSQGLPDKPLFCSFKIIPQHPHPSYFLLFFLKILCEGSEGGRRSGQKTKRFLLWHRFTSNTSFNKAVYLRIKRSLSIHKMWILSQRINADMWLLWLVESSVEWKEKSYCLEKGP